MNCKSVQNRLSAYLDRELGGDELLQMRAHMAMCRDCRTEADGLRSLKALLGGIQCPEPPSDLPERLTANMLRQRMEAPRRNYYVSAAMFAGVAACSMAITLIVLNAGGAKRPRPEALRDGSTGGSILSRYSESADSLSADRFDSRIVSAANFGPR